ncbi:MAG TPA: hypothetical protein VIV60_21055 [Polyangiaceae bacterium]
MSGLSPELRKLLPVYKDANRPTDADSARVIEGLRARLGEGAFTAGPQSTQVATTTASTGLVIGKGAIIGLAGLAVAGGVWLLTTQRPRAAVTEAKPAVERVEVLAPNSNSSSAPTAIERESSQGLATAMPTAAGGNVRPAASHHARDKLAQEVALLARAQAALGSGKPAVALDVLNEHERRFGRGLLTEERTAARIQALCALGRSTEADAQLARLSPTSLHGRDSRQACSSRAIGRDGTATKQ